MKAVAALSVVLAAVLGAVLCVIGLVANVPALSTFGGAMVAAACFVVSVLIAAVVIGYTLIGFAKLVGLVTSLAAAYAAPSRRPR